MTRRRPRRRDHRREAAGGTTYARRRPNAGQGKVLILLVGHTNEKYRGIRIVGQGRVIYMENNRFYFPPDLKLAYKTLCSQGAVQSYQILYT